MSKKPKSARPLTPEEQSYRAWVDTSMAALGLSLKELGGAIRRSEGTASKIRNGIRPVKLAEVAKISKLFGPTYPPPNGQVATFPASTIEEGQPIPSGLPIDAIIAPGYWRDAGADVAVVAPTPVAGRLEPKFAKMKQYACAVRADPSRFIICVPFAAVRPEPIQDDEVHVRRIRANGEQEDTIRMVHIVGGKVRLVLEDAPTKDKDRSLAYPSKRDDEQIQIKGLVVGTFTAKPV